MRLRHRRSVESLRTTLAGLAAAILFAAATHRLGDSPAPTSDRGLMVVLPAHVQTALAAGDRHLAANNGVFRVLAYPLDLMTDETALVKARIQEETSLLNPAHEDNYYLAAATLEDRSLVRPVFKVLDRASAARPYDVLPPLYLGLSYGLQLDEHLRGAQYILLAASRETDQRNRMSLERLSAKWAARGAEPDAGVRFLEALSRQARSQKMKAYFDERIRALQGVIELRSAVDRFKASRARLPRDLDELVAAGSIDKLPIPARGYVFVLDETGRPLHLRQR